MTTEFRIMFVDDCGDETCYFYDEEKNQYYDSTYFGDYTEGDVVRVSWRCFDGINREVSSVEKIA